MCKIVHRNLFFFPYFKLVQSCWQRLCPCLLASRGWTPVRKHPSPHSPSPDIQWTRTFIDGGRGLCAETAESALTIIMKSFCGLISVVLIVLRTFNLQFQNQFVPISLRPILRIVAAYVMVIMQLTFFHLVMISVSIRQFTEYGS